MPKLKIELCADCTTKIRDLHNTHGREAVNQASVSIIADCARCSVALPPTLRAAVQAGCYTSRGKDEPAPGMVEVGTIELPVGAKVR